MSGSGEFTASLFAREQFRMTRLQVLNWGTFSDLHDIPIAKRGFLFVGPSGAGKSTLLDAFSALLTPPRWVDFNAAAREAERTGRDRSFMSYVRGAWGEQKDEESGLIAARHLRPDTTWSALSLSFGDGRGRGLSLVQLFWVRGKSVAAADVRRHYLIFDRGFDLRELKDFDLDVRKLKRAFPEAFIRDDFTSYCERFRRALGIESELALRLLHKTQSAKNLGDLNEFLRDFMLDKPQTFDVADRLVSDFGELNAAHHAVVTARDQIGVLAPAREDHGSWQETAGRGRSLEELRGGIEGYLPWRLAGLLEQRLEGLLSRGRGLQSEVRLADEGHEALKAQKEELLELRRRSGGDQIERWEAELRRLETERADRSGKRRLAETTCARLGLPAPGSAMELAELASGASRELESWRERADRDQEEKFRLDREKTAAEASFARAVAEVNALRAQPSNIPADMLGQRRKLSAALGVPESEFPFAGELLEVREEDAEWQGAIERVMRGFALSILVEERNYTAVSAHVNATHLGQRLVYYRVGKAARESGHAPRQDSLVHKLLIKKGPYGDWLDSELRQRFDFACAESLQAFRSAEYAITREGQIRQGRSRHEKNDRTRVDDRRQWVLGFSNQAKLRIFEQEAQDLSRRIEELRRAIDRITEAGRDGDERRLHCQTLVNLSWPEIDVETTVSRIAGIERDLKLARKGNEALAGIEKRITGLVPELQAADKRCQRLRTELSVVERDIREDEKQLERARRESASLPISEAQRLGLDERLAGESDAVSIASLEGSMRKVSGRLTRELDRLQSERVSLERAVEERFAEFKRRWPLEAAEMDAKLASATDFFAKLERLERDGLPAYEERFFELLRTQSHQNLAALSTHLGQARKEIADRLELVNEGLRDAPFNPGTILHIQPSDRQLPDVTQFKREIREALSNAWTDDRQGAEARFLILRRLVERLSSQETADRRWRESVLDVRQHVEFIGRELDPEGRQVEVYRSGSGKSGGQRQKLATTCLAAALRYQLGGHDRHPPAYRHARLLDPQPAEKPDPAREVGADGRAHPARERGPLGRGGVPVRRPRASWPDGGRACPLCQAEIPSLAG